MPRRGYSAERPRLALPSSVRGGEVSCVPTEDSSEQGFIIEPRGARRWGATTCVRLGTFVFTVGLVLLVLAGVDIQLTECSTTMVDPLEKASFTPAWRISWRHRPYRNSITLIRSNSFVSTYSLLVFWDASIHRRSADLTQFTLLAHHLESSSTHIPHAIAPTYTSTASPTIPFSAVSSNAEVPQFRAQTVVQELNARFATGRGGPRSELPGVLIHVFDGFVRQWDAPWRIQEVGAHVHDMVKQQLMRGGQSSYNEIIIDARSFEGNAPRSIVAVFSQGSATQEARKAHALLLRHFRINNDELPLVQLNPLFPSPFMQMF
ncbi:MAG: hypothetical protein SGPRY_004655 [Prymnesium sp.]